MVAVGLQNKFPSSSSSSSSSSSALSPPEFSFFSFLEDLLQFTLLGKKENNPEVILIDSSEEGSNPMKQHDDTLSQRKRKKRDIDRKQFEKGEKRKKEENEGKKEIDDQDCEVIVLEELSKSQVKPVLIDLTQDSDEKSTPHRQHKWRRSLKEDEQQKMRGIKFKDLEVTRLKCGKEHWMRQIRPFGIIFFCS